MRVEIKLRESLSEIVFSLQPEAAGYRIHEEARPVREYYSCYSKGGHAHVGRERGFQSQGKIMDKLSGLLLMSFFFEDL